MKYLAEFILSNTHSLGKHVIVFYREDMLATVKQQVEDVMPTLTCSSVSKHHRVSCGTPSAVTQHFLCYDD